MHTLGVVSSLDAGRQVAERLNTTESVKKLYSVLLALSYDWIDHKAYNAVPTHVTFHSSLTLISAVIGIDRVTAWRSLCRLKILGCVDWRSSKGKLFDKVRNTGTVFQVRLDALQGTRAKLSYQDLKHEYKDLTRLARCKRLTHQVLQPIKSLEDQSLKYLLLREWTVKPYTAESPVIDSRLHGGIESLLAVPHLQGKEVAKGIDTASRILATALQDSRSTDFYRKLLWRLKRRTEATGLDEFHTLYLQVNRVIKADIPEWQGLRSGAALLVSRLKAYQWYSEVMT